MQLRILFFIVVSICFVSCSDTNYKKTKSGLLYKIFSNGKGSPVKKGEVLKINFTQKVRDSVLGSSYNSTPAYALVDSVGPLYNPAEVFPFLRKGDSVVIVMLGDSIKKFGLPPFMKDSDKMILTLKVLDVFPNRQLADNDRAAETSKASELQIKALDQYIADKKISAQKTGSGLYVEIKTKGQGPAADSGKLVSVKYTGKLFPSEKVFESNADAGKPPFEFVIGTGQVIRGWDEGLKQLNKGGKATLYIPAPLAYGPQRGPGGQAFENLIFDVEVVDVKDAPKPQQAPILPPPVTADTSARKK